MEEIANRFRQSTTSTDTVQQACRIREPVKKMAISPQSLGNEGIEGKLKNGPVLSKRGPISARVEDPE